MEKNVYAIIDGQAGSCGKGKVIGQFALENSVEVAIANCMPNAGHTFSENGVKRIFRNIPVSSVNKNTTLFIGAGSVIDMDVLEEEYENNKDLLEGREIIVHPLVPLITKKHIETEKQILKSGSTFKGGGACLADKIMRHPDLKFFKDYQGLKAHDNYHDILIDYLKNAKKILIEGSQGCDLDLNHSGHYPHVTSRQISVEQMLADSGVSSRYLKELIMVIRPFPIRISNKTNIGKSIYSGSYGKSEELSWDQINVGAYLGQYPTTITKEDIEAYVGDLDYDFTEQTTVTQQIRRVFDLDIAQLKRTIERNMPDSLYLNFFQHLGNQYSNLRGNFQNQDIIKYQREYINHLEFELGVPITTLGTGADLKDYIVIKQDGPKLAKKRF